MPSYEKPEWWDEWVIKGIPLKIKEDAPEWVKKEFKEFMEKTY